MRRKLHTGIRRPDCSDENSLPPFIGLIDQMRLGFNKLEALKLRGEGFPERRRDFIERRQWLIILSRMIGSDDSWISPA